MSVALTIEIRDEATPWLAELGRRCAPDRVGAALGPGITRLLQRHFIGRGANQRGWPSTHFWGRAAAATNWSQGAGHVTVGVNQVGVRQRYFGGPILPVKAQMLTIPAGPEAYGKTAGEFGGELRVTMVTDPDSGRLRLALARRRGTVTGGRGKGLKSLGGRRRGEASALGNEPLFWLARGVRQAPDPGVIPADDEIRAEMMRIVRGLLN